MLFFSKLSTPVFKGVLLFFLVFQIVVNTACQKSTVTEKDYQNSSMQQEIRSASNDAGNIQVRFPAEDPGAPFYARAGKILNQYFIADGWLVIPFFRDPNCIRPDFNMLSIFDVPAAFSCALTVEGYYLIEKNAPIGAFPILVQSTGKQVPVWMVRWTDFQAAAADDIVTIAELEAMSPLKGIADKFHETLRPRMENHLVQISAKGQMNDGRSFSFHVTHVGDQTKSIGLSIK